MSILKHNENDLYKIANERNISIEKINVFLTSLDKYKNKIFIDLSLTETINNIDNKLRNTGLSNNYINKLLEISFRKDILVGLYELMGYESYLKKIKETINDYNMTLDDPIKFYIDNKGQKGFRRYGSLSLAYTNISLINIINKIIKDSEQVSSFLTDSFFQEMEEIYGNGEDYVKICIEIIVDNNSIERMNDKVKDYENIKTNIPFNRLEEALLQDIRCSGINIEIINEFKNTFGYNSLEQDRGYNLAETFFSKRDFLDRIFCYFSQIENIKEFNDQRLQNHIDKQNIINNFKEKIYNDPSINPRLLGMRISDIGSKKFKEELIKWIQKKGDNIYNENNLPRSPDEFY